MRWQNFGSKTHQSLLIAIAPVVAILLWSMSSSVGIAAEPASASEASRPRTFELQLMAPDRKPVPHAEVRFRNEPAVKREHVKVGEFVRADKYSARINTDAAGKIDDVPPGSYQLNVWLQQQQGPQRPNNHHITMAAPETEQADAPVDVGAISLDGS